MAQTKKPRELEESYVIAKEAMAIMAQTHPVTGWNLLVRDYPNHIRVREFLSYDKAREAQETEIKRNHPQWTAVVRDKRSRNNASNR